MGSEECVKLLLEHKADPNRWECRHEMKATPLHCAASAKSLACVKVSLDCFCSNFMVGEGYKSTSANYL